MRWHVHGTDAATGQDLVLAVNEEEAAHAVQSAMARRILVSHVTRDAGDRLRRLLVPLAAAVVVVILPLCVGLYVLNTSVRAKLAQAVTEQARLAQAVAQAEAIAADVRQAGPGGMPAAEAAARVRELAEQLAAARTKASQSEQQLAATYQQMNMLERAANQLPQVQAQLASADGARRAAEARAGRLADDLALEQRRLKELAAAPPPPPPGPSPEERARAQALERANKDLAAQIDLLKSQLLVAAAQSTAPAAAAEPDAVRHEPAAPTRWALRVGYDVAAEFLTMNFAKDTFATTALSDGAVATAGVRPANAATCRILHDRAKDRVYGGSLTLSFAPDAPRDKWAENAQLAGRFIKAFAPAFRDPDAAVAAAVGQLAGKDGSQRLVWLGDDCKLTVWNNRMGVYTFRIESPRAEEE